jgi:hypothetical protein
VGALMAHGPIPDKPDLIVERVTVEDGIFMAHGYDAETFQLGEEEVGEAEGRRLINRLRRTLPAVRLQRS